MNIYFLHKLNTQANISHLPCTYHVAYKWVKNWIIHNIRYISMDIPKWRMIISCAIGITSMNT
jgi:hypothetical protein